MLKVLRVQTVQRVLVPRVLTVRRVLVPKVLTVRRLLTVLVGVLLLSGCHAELPPIRQKGAWLVVENQTTSAWTNVSVTLNAYYRGTSSALAAGSRLEAPLANFVTGFGQRFNTAREHVSRVEVRATDASGKPVTLDWDEHTGPPLVQEGK